MSPIAVEESASNLPPDLLHMLALRNGFYAFEGALHVFPLGAGISGSERSVIEWNRTALWRAAYGAAAEGLTYFAEDVFGNQFALDRDMAVVLFDAETGAASLVASSLPDWPGALLDDYEYLTGWPVCRRWQLTNGLLPVGHRLVPKVPFVAGGSFDISNLVAMDAVRSMRLRAGIAEQIRDLPDGTPVRLVISDD